MQFRPHKLASLLGIALVSFFATGLFLPRSAAQAGGPCRCLYQADPTGTSLGQPPSQCIPSGGLNFIVVLNLPTARNGECNLPSCTPTNCTASGTLTVTTDTPCRVDFTKNGSPVGGGFGPTVWIAISDNLECADFVDYKIFVDGVAIFLITNICKNCPS